MFETEHPFTLPMGYVGKDGDLHREGVMRLATAADEIAPLRDDRVQKNPAYLTIIVLSRVVASLDGIEHVTPAIIEGLFAADLAYLQDLYNDINRLDGNHLPVTCPECDHEFEVERVPLGGSSATPSIN
jgi:hypothetical protein